MGIWDTVRVNYRILEIKVPRVFFTNINLIDREIHNTDLKLSESLIENESISLN